MIVNETCYFSFLYLSARECRVSERTCVWCGPGQLVQSDVSAEMPGIAALLLYLMPKPRAAAFIHMLTMPHVHSPHMPLFLNVLR